MEFDSSFYDLVDAVREFVFAAKNSLLEAIKMEGIIGAVGLLFKLLKQLVKESAYKTVLEAIEFSIWVIAAAWAAHIIVKLFNGLMF